MNTPPLISVIIPTFNRSKLLMNALDSVFSQTFKDFEVLVIDDGSTDDTEQAVQSYRSGNSLSEKLRYFKQPNQGQCVAFNAGLDAAFGEWTAFLDSDDVWLPNKLELQWEALNRCSTECGACFTDVRFVNNARRTKTGCEEAGLVFRGEFVCISTPASFTGAEHEGLFIQSLLIRKEICKQIGGFDTKLFLFQDNDFIFRLACHAGIYLVNRPLVLMDRTPNREVGLIELFEVAHVRLPQQQYLYEKRLVRSTNLSHSVRTQIGERLRSVHSEWSNYYLMIGDFRGARESARRALSYRWSARTACKLLLTTLAPTLARKLVVKRAGECPQS
jgi:glycosyltransferase involved in cell wall biosynthesis